jgi:hypothetical protein
MNTSRQSQSLARANRRLAAVLVLIGLFIQAMAPYLPMPGMGGRIAWDFAGAALAGGQVAWLPSCLSPQAGEGDGAPNPATHLGDCPACLVMQLAGATLLPNAFEQPVQLAALGERPVIGQQAPRLAAPSEGFSSRAPPRLV